MSTWAVEDVLGVAHYGWAPMNGLLEQGGGRNCGLKVWFQQDGLLLVTGMGIASVRMSSARYAIFRHTGNSHVTTRRLILSVSKGKPVANAWARLKRAHKAGFEA